VYLPPTRLFAQRLQAFPSTDTSVLSLMANLFTQRSLGGGVQQHAALVASTSKMDWRLETTVGSGGVACHCMPAFALMHVFCICFTHVF